MMMGGDAQLSVLWLIAMIVLLIIEAVVPGLISIWFALGALAALVAALFHAPFWLQVVWFQDWAYVNNRVTPTNADMVIGKEAVVTEAIDNLQEKGAVRLDGKIWTARMADENAGAEVGETVRILRIEGVKLITERIKT